MLKRDAKISVERKRKGDDNTKVFMKSGDENVCMERGNKRKIVW